MARADSKPDGMVRRGRPPQISKEQIVEAAVEIGLDSFSIQGIADRLGVTPPALYSHVSGRDEIVGLVAADLIARLDVPADDHTDWREWLVAFGKQARLHFADAATALQVDLSGPLALERLTSAEKGLRLLEAAGFSAADAGRALWLIFRAACTAGPRGGASVRTPMAEARKLADPSSHPAIDRAIDGIIRSPTPDALDFDLRVIVDGLDRRRARS